MNAPDWSAKGRRQLLHASVVSVLDADELDLECRWVGAELTIGAGPPESANVSIWPCDEESPVLFIGAERAATKGDTR